MAKSKKIVMTGGGTAGHVTPNIALMPALQEAGYEITYIGSYNGMEKELIEAQKIPYIGISSGKLRRYFDWKNFSDPFKVLKGYGQAISILRKLKPDVVFSKGGFVSVPVVLAAKHCHIPAIIHESDITPGLANKIAIRGAKKVCCNFPETMKYLPAEKAVLTGSPIRRELFHGDAEKSLHYCGFPDHNKPVLLIVGGSSGSKVINEAVRKVLPELLEQFYIIHLCGKGNLDEKLKGVVGYAQFEYAAAAGGKHHLGAPAEASVNQQIPKVKIQLFHPNLSVSRDPFFLLYKKIKKVSRIIHVLRPCPGGFLKKCRQIGIKETSTQYIGINEAPF